MHDSVTGIFTDRIPAKEMGVPNWVGTAYTDKHVIAELDEIGNQQGVPI